MLDKRTAYLLDKINELCEKGTYKVLETEELLAVMPEKLFIDRDALKQMLDYLKEREYIDIKYSDDENYCLCPLPKGRLYFESENSEKETNARICKTFLWTAFLGAFVGAIIGSVIVAVIAHYIG